jgi:hypothetical protein
MTRNYGLVICLLILIVVLLPVAGSCQDSAKVVILSPRVGPVISLYDRDRFHIFGAIEGYRSATVFQAPDSTFYVRFSCRARGDSTIERRVSYPLQLLLTIAEKIDHIELLEAGNYRMGSDPARVRYAESKASVPLTPAVTALRREAKHDLSDLLPFAFHSPLTAGPEYPRFGITIGLSSFPVDIGSISKMVQTMKSYYGNLGYPITLSEPQENPEIPLWFSVEVRFSRDFGATLEAATSTGDGQVSVRVGAVDARYYPPLGFPEVLQPFLGVGIDFVKISLTEDLISGSVISQTDQSGGYVTLDKVAFSSSHTSLAPRISAGIEACPDASHNPAFRFSASYLAPTRHPLMMAGLSDTSASTVDLKTGGLILEIQLVVYF